MSDHDRAARQGAPPEVQEHFESFEKQEHAVRLGMWVFLGSETLLFAGLFGLYAAYRTMHSDTFVEAAGHNNAWLGTAMTLILLVSSFSVAWSIHAIRKGNRKITLLSLLVTMALGALFLGLKLYEYFQHFHEGIYPGSYYSYEQLAQPGHQLFYTLYFFMTGLHALHVTAGLAILGWLAVRTARFRIRAEQHTALEMGGLYWHLVDIVWIFLWPLLYLVG